MEIAANFKHTHRDKLLASNIGKSNAISASHGLGLLHNTIAHRLLCKEHGCPIVNSCASKPSQHQFWYQVQRLLVLG